MPLQIGLVNNMPDSALEATEAQFLSLLRAASGGRDISVTRYMIPDVPRQAAARRFLRNEYASVEDLWTRHLDGIVVTGREPLAADLKDEPYWRTFAKLVDWAQTNTHSAVWSCLAAHAAVLHLDGIRRVRRHAKLFGVYPCARSSDDFLLTQAPSPLQSPHSRWNGLPADRLIDAGYQIITRTLETEADTFVKSGSSLFLFFQGHPEYNADSLLREYHRDVKRYFDGETANFPSVPENYFPCETEASLRQLQQQYGSQPTDAFLPAFRKIMKGTAVTATWQTSAVAVYSNWLGYLHDRRSMTCSSVA